MRRISLAISTIPIILTVVWVAAFSSTALAKVTGLCSNCHTMHNSQDGTSVSTDGPYETLLTDDCVGCHSNTTGSDTIKVLDSTRVPVVYNTSEPANELAGGNFYWVARTEGSEYGHNVLSIPGMPSDTLTKAPGMPSSADYPNCASCHWEIADCTSCHKPAHHADDSATVVGETGGWYRFLKSGSYNHDGGGVEGIEDSDWERADLVDSDKHNEYQGATASASGGDDTSMSDYCAGCHEHFHGTLYVGTSSPWFLHPAHYALPADTGKEYCLYNTKDGSTIGPYNPYAPVARPVLTGYSGPSSTVTPGTDQVFCLSCHRPHGTPNKDILRWDYAGMIAGTTGATAGTGCFICHTSKDGQ
jgi:predicted CXXCH cytochrome family protein